MPLWRTTSALLFILCIAGCVKKPVTAPRAVVPETVSAELRIAAAPGKNFGSMLALGIGMSNGETATYVVTADRIFAVDEAGNRIAPLSVEEAARQAGGATALVAGLEGAGGSALLTGLLGAIPGAIIGASQGGGSGAGAGAAIGAGIGIAVGAVGGFYESKTKTEQEIIDQLHGLYFGEQTLKPALPVSGFVFYPAGSYTGVRAVLVEKTTNAVKEVAGPMIPKP
ncbi:MAG TPA: hypothetical protein VMW56_06900 [Candidatus Margulisiibacteriota bacterium]|nr:hypothetical protein [Candidatus Margulisiibacteriota bacterium]